MIGPAEIDDMMLDHAAAILSVAEPGTPDRLPHRPAIWAWWLNPVMLLAFETQKAVVLWFVRLAWSGRENRDGAVPR